MMNIKTILLLGVVVSQVACNLKVEDAVLSGIEAGATTGINTTIEDLKSSRELVEAFAHDIKQRYKDDDERYVTSESKFEAARAALDGYFAALRLAVLNTETSEVLLTPAQEATSAVSDFVGYATQQLDPTLDTRKIPFTRAVSLPKAVPRWVGRIGRDRRQAALQGLADQVMWRRWAEL
jgi:hypothetical protein